MSRKINVRFNENEINALKKIADTHGVGLSTMIKTLALEKLSDDYDIKVIKEYEESKKNKKIELVDHDDAWKEIDQ
ncbi:MAG: DUF6290 family protein [Finegoldia magna]|uniref:CopG family transcriptional regulator n=3 Tax=Finegoldia magna TaxID=1260 RepID=B0RZM3_FINM2|nr:DUF6290 family protein [Finegoldia magna]EFK93906.1 hypothetical protein HMPREF9261_0094 [Finegoldia magna ACS-171-V-Col3]EFL53261.1 hypothetical protein HMPREF9289_0103 [Finegoldia magna BVS033A4]EXF27224.1 hypothetical protein BA93_00685 [Finegoldia magna ALB8]MBS5776191.1 hypothetical protein [Finegoldia magna]MDU2575761.1 DUF6290 family protein [Finegoldia magna]